MRHQDSGTTARGRLRGARQADARRRARLIPVAVLAALCLGTSATIASAEDEGFAYDLAGELMSPYCPGRTVASCPSPQASELIQWISLQEAGGASRDEVVDMLIDRFGEEILGAPPAEGITLWAYVFPVAGFLGGGGAVWLVLRRIVGRRDDDDDDEGGAGPISPSEDRPTSAADEPEQAASSLPDDELERLVDEELANRR